MPNPTKLIFVPPTGGTVDWSPYFINISPIQRRIESDKPGEAGVMMFDTVTIEMPLSKTGSYFDEDTLFGGTAKPKYHVQIKKHISGTDYQLFEGLIDVDSLKFTRHGTVQFDCYDKLSALKFYPTQPARTKTVLNPPFRGGILCQFRWAWVSDEGWYFRIWNPGSEEWEEWDAAPILDAFSILLHPHYYRITSPPEYPPVVLDEKICFITRSEILDNTYMNLDTTPGAELQGAYLNRITALWRYSKNFYGVNIIIDESTDPKFDAFTMLEAIIKSVYPSITVSNRTGDTTFPISFGFFEQTVNMPFDRPILEAIKYLAASMRVYVYIDRSGQFIIDKWPGFGSEPSSKPDLSGFQTEDDYRFTWDKLVDQVTIETVAADGTKTEAVAGTEYKNPVNTLERTVFASDDSAQDVADAYFDFYGKRHRARSITRKLDATVAQLDLISWVDVGDIDFRDDTDLYYFIEKMGLDVMNDTVDLDLVSVKPFDL